MSQDKGISKLKGVLVIYILTHLFYGILFLFLPAVVFAMSGSPDPLGLSWIRWAGGPLLALAIGALQVYRNPAGQNVFMTIAITSALLVGLGIGYSKIFDNSTSALWFHMTPCFINISLFVLLLWARQGAKEILQ